jgi:hypothetical protein
MAFQAFRPFRALQPFRVPVTGDQAPFSSLCLWLLADGDWDDSKQWCDDSQWP